MSSSDDPLPAQASTGGRASEASLANNPTRYLPGQIAIASALAVCGSLLARLLFGVLTPAEVFGDQLTVLMPAPVFDFFIRTFDGATKHFYFIGLVFCEAVVLWGTTLFVLRAFPVRSVRTPWWHLAGLVAGLWLVVAGVLAPLIGGGYFGANLAGGVIGVFLSLLVLDGLFVLLLPLLYPGGARVSAARAADPRFGRRELLRRGGFAVGIVALGSIGWEVFSGSLSALLGVGTGANRYPLPTLPETGQIVPPPTPSYTTWPPIPGQTTEITPTADFYYVSKNIASDPQIDARTWTLTVDGQVSSPFTLTLAELQALPQTQRYQTLECISNEVGGDLMSNAVWTGVSLASVIERAGLVPGMSELVFTCADGYSDSLHLSQALDPRSLIAYQINGEALPVAHGYPARLIVPGLYGMKNGKWITHLTIDSGGYQGYWEHRGWTREAIVQLEARIDIPHNQDLLIAGPVSIAGVAFAGATGIAQVQVSTDGGQSWQIANLRRPLSDTTWVLWEYPWQATPGSYLLVVRAVDLQGYVQTSAVRPPIPDGATGYDAVYVTVH